METMELTERQRRVLAAFEQREVLHIYDLPLGVGRGTMEGLTHLGLVELADPEAGLYSSKCAWKLAKKPE
jgi:hypothetical protein